jgi:hypothetical protein
LPNEYNFRVISETQKGVNYIIAVNLKNARKAIGAATLRFKISTLIQAGLS